MSNSARYVKRKVTGADDVAWVAITAPFDCDYFGIRNLGTNVLLERTDSTDAATEDEIAVHDQDGAFSGVRRRSLSSSTGARFRAGDTIIYVKAKDNSNTCDYVLTFLER